MARNTHPFFPLLLLSVVACDQSSPDELEGDAFRGFQSAEEVAASFTLDLTPDELIVAEVGHQFDITITADFFDFSNPFVERYTVVWDIVAPDVVIWAGAFVGFWGNQGEPHGDVAPASDDFRKVWWDFQWSGEHTFTITGACANVGLTAIVVRASRHYSIIEGQNVAVVPVYCYDGLHWSGVTYEHESECSLYGEPVKCPAGTRLTSVDFACVDPTLREGGDPNVSTDIECAGGLDVLGNFDGPLATDRRDLGVTVDSELTYAISQTEGGTEGDIECVEVGEGTSCDPGNAVFGGRIPPPEGQPLTLGSRIDVRVDGHDGELVYSDVLPPLATFSEAEDAGANEPVALWEFTEEQDPEAAQHYLHWIFD